MVTIILPPAVVLPPIMFCFPAGRVLIHFAYNCFKEADGADQERRRLVQPVWDGRWPQVVSVGTLIFFVKDVIYTCTYPSSASYWFAIAANQHILYIYEWAMTYQGLASKVRFPDVWQLANPIVGHPLSWFGCGNLNQQCQTHMDHLLLFILLYM